MLRAEINVQLERQNALLAEKDNQIAASNRTIVINYLGIFSYYVELISVKHSCNLDNNFVVIALI
jgi:hypothetical protein